MKLKDACLNITDGTHSTVLDSPNGNNYLLSCKNVKLGHILISDNDRRIDDRTLLALRARTKMATNDVVLSSVGTIGEVALIKQNPNYEFQRSVAILKPNASIILPGYLMYFLMSKKGQSIIRGHIKGAAQPCLFLNDIKDIEIPLMDTAIQQHIVNTIGSVDDLIEKYASLTNKAKYLARLLFNDTFPELSLDGIDSQKRLDDYLEKITTGLNPRQNFKLGHGLNYYVTVKNIDDGRLLLDESCDKVDDEALSLINKRSQLDKDTILFTGIGSIGRTFYVYEKPRNWNISESVFAFRAGNNISPEFLYMLLTSDVFQSYCINNASGSAQKGIRMEYLKKYPMPVLEQEKMQVFNNRIKPLVNLLFEYDKRTTQLLKAKQFLLNKYF